MIHSVKVLREKIEEIKGILKEIEEFDMSMDDVLDYFHDNHLNLLKDFPFLIKQLHSKEDNTMLEVMLKTLEEQEQEQENGKTNKSKKEIDTDIGDILANVYLKDFKKV
jgi:hypothetical protein